MDFQPQAVPFGRRWPSRALRCGSRSLTAQILEGRRQRPSKTICSSVSRVQGKLGCVSCFLSECEHNIWLSVHVCKQCTLHMMMFCSCTNVIQVKQGSQSVMSLARRNGQHKLDTRQSIKTKHPQHVDRFCVRRLFGSGCTYGSRLAFTSSPMPTSSHWETNL